MTAKKGITYWSEEFIGTPKNYNWAAQCDVTDGFLRISQIKEGHVEDVVLLSASQAKKIWQFYKEHCTKKGA